MLLSRRTFLGSATVSATAPLVGAAVAQEAGLPELDPAEAASAHSRQLFQAVQIVVERDPLLQQSIIAAIEALVEQGVIEPEDAQLLIRLISILFGDVDLESLRARVADVLEEIIPLLSQVAETIARLVSDSVAAALELLSGLDADRIVQAILHDVRGALDGAATGYTLGRRPGGIIGAVCGSVSSSVIGFLETRR